MNFTLSQEEYEALIALAQKGVATPDERRNLDAWLRRIEASNGIQRYQLWVQWQEADSPLPPGTSFPETWPPTQRAYIEFLSRPVGLADVQRVLQAKARKPVTVLVTPDPGAILGWTALETYFR
jgi:hypothetical protein